jgi:glycosyltransferase involved in cell wall biosynthesis
MRIAEISHFFCYAAYRQKAAAMAQLAGEKELLLTPAGWTEDYHGCGIEPDQSDDYRLIERQAYLNWAIWGGKRFQLFVLSPQIIGDLKNYQPDIIEVDSEPFGLLAFEAALIRRLFFPKSRLIVHSSQNLYKHYPFPFSATEAFVLRQADAIFARSDEIMQVLLRKRCQCPVHVIPHGVDPERFSPDGEAEASPGNSHPLHIGYVGSLAKHKGVHLLIEAVSASGFDLALTIIGNGPERPALTAQAGRSPKVSRIKFGNSVPNIELPVFLGTLDVLVLPSISMPNWKEQFGRIIIEAMACGVPVVGSTCGSIPEVIGDGGLVFPENDAVQLQLILETLVKDRALLSELSVKARERVMRHFAWNVVALKAYNILRGLV